MWSRRSRPTRRQPRQLAQSISDWPKSSPGYFRDVQTRLKKFVESGQLGPFTNGYWGNPAYKLPPEANLMAVAHYLEALDFQKEIVKIHTIFGGKNPHPNWLVGGVPCAINLDEVGAVGAINMERLNYVKSIIDQSQDVHRTGLHPRPAGDRLVLQGLALRRRPVRQDLHVLRRHSRSRQRLHVREPALPARRGGRRQARCDSGGRPSRSASRSRSL